MNGLTSQLALVPRPGADGSPFSRPTVVAVDMDAVRLEVTSDDPDSTMLIPALGEIDQYRAGDVVLVARDAIGPVALGPIGRVAEVPELPSTGTVTAISGSVVTVSTTAGPIAAGSVVSAVISNGDAVVLMWDADGKAWVVGKRGVAATAPTTPTGLDLTREGNTVTAVANPVSGATSYRFRYTYGSTWAYVVTSAPVATFGLAQGQALSVGVQARNTGGASAFSSTKNISRDAASKTETAEVTVQPSDSGTYRHSVNRWDDWNRGQYDWPRTLYQGNDYGSGDMTGLAVYGNRIKDLGAVEITKATLTVRRNNWDAPGAESAVVQGATDGKVPSGAPSTTGSTVTTPSMGKGGTRTVDLPESMCEALRTGAIKGLALVGSGDAGFYGTGGSMSIEITYRRLA